MSDQTVSAKSNPPKKISEPESTYTIAELAQAAKSLRAAPECVHAALKAKKAERFTFIEAKSIVDAFMKKEVK